MSSTPLSAPTIRYCPAITRNRLRTACHAYATSSMGMENPTE